MFNAIVYIVWSVAIVKCFHCLLVLPLPVITTIVILWCHYWCFLCLLFGNCLLVHLLSTSVVIVYWRYHLSICVIDLTTVPNVLSILIFSIAYLFFNCLQVLQLSNYATIVYWFPVVNWCYHCLPVSFPNISFFLTLNKRTVADFIWFLIMNRWPLHQVLNLD